MLTEHGEVLGSQTTYQDDYGNDKMLTVVDHTPKKSFYFSMTERERQENLAKIREIRSIQIIYILNLPEQLMERVAEYYPHLTIDGPNHYPVWNEDRLNCDSLQSDHEFLNSLYTHVRNIESAHNASAYPGTGITPH